MHEGEGFAFSVLLFVIDCFILAMQERKIGGH